MRPGPVTGAGSASAEETMTDKARRAWGAELPEWVEELASLAQDKGLKGAAARIGYSTSVVSNVINNCYRGDMSRVEQMVRGALMGAQVLCPALGDLRRDQCLRWQRQPFVPTNAARARLHRVCNATCEHYRKGGSDAQS